MAHIDTLKYYEELINAGNSELEAKAHIYNLNNTLTDLVTKDDLHKEMDRLADKIESKFEAKFNTLRTLGWAFFGGLMLPLLKIAFWP